MEVKGVTLEEHGICRFPDAPTLRGSRHLEELRKAKQAGYGAYVFFVIQMEGVRHLEANKATDPLFDAALQAAAADGVTVLAYDCHVTPQEMVIRAPVPVQIPGKEIPDGTKKEK